MRRSADEIADAIADRFVAAVVALLASIFSLVLIVVSIAAGGVMLVVLYGIVVIIFRSAFGVHLRIPLTTGNRQTEALPSFEFQIDLKHRIVDEASSKQCVGGTKSRQILGGAMAQRHRDRQRRKLASLFATALLTGLIFISLFAARAIAGGCRCDFAESKWEAYATDVACSIWMHKGKTS
jgi:hypothetical protein